MRFKYSAVDPVSALDAIQKSAREAALKHGGIPSWIELSKGNIWLVRGTPWREVRPIILVPLCLFLTTSIGYE